ILNNKRHLFLVFVFFVSSISLIACSSSRNEDYGYFNHNENDGKRKLVFHDDNVKWKVIFEDGRIDKLYKNDRQLSENEIAEYEDYIYDRVEQIDNELFKLHVNMEDFHFDMEKFKKDMAKMHEDMESRRFDFSFDGEQLRKDMKKMTSKLKLAFESGEFEEDMRKLHKEMEDIKVDIDVDKIHEDVQRAMENIDMSELHEQMAELKSELKKSKSEIKRAKKGVRKFNRFMNDLTEELEKDGIIDDADDDFDMEFNSREMIIDGEKVPAELHQKYKDMYEEKMDRKMDDDMSIKTNEW
ncbi:MAG: hypothetical protein R6W90_06465, partial [Ignavibacteriaceae bacterium]